MDDRRHDQDGIALISVMGFMVIVLLLAGVAFSLGINTQRQSYAFADTNAALNIADAGLNDYLARLNRVPNYANIASEAAPGDNPALDGWASIPGAEGEYHVDVDTSTLTSSGSVVVRATGRVGEAERTLETTFRPDGFLDYIYFTQYEAIDPEVFGTSLTDCSRYAYGTPPRQDSQCGVIRFIGADVIRGPFHTNDAILLEGNPRFEGRATTSYRGPSGTAGSGDCTTAANPLWIDRLSGSAPDFVQDLCWTEALDVPADNQSIQDQTTGTTTSTSGCAYYGPTYIELYDPDPNVDNDGRMRVVSPSSRDFPGSVIATDSTRCGSTGELADRTNGADRPIPPNGVIYVDDQTWSSCTNGTAGHPLRLPRSGDVRSQFTCSDGDVFLWGELDGQLTIGTSNDVNVVWDVTYAEPIPDSDDLLGLVANNFVQVYRPIDASDDWLDHFGVDGSGTNVAPFLPGRLPTPGAGGTRTWQDPEINAAIMAVRRSFGVDNYFLGGRGTGALTVRGAIAQYFRGPVGRGSNGYDKDYVYDDRLEYLSPPFFVQPGGDTDWGARTWAEIPPPNDLP